MSTPVCTNCDKPIYNAADMRVFHKVVVCTSCHKIVVTKYEKAAKLVDSVLVLYADILRQALIKKQAHLPVIPEGTMPIGELPAAMNILKVINANGSEKQQARKDPV